MSKTDDFAILAPVPLEHLETGMEIAAKEPFVAYGSGKWGLFREIDRRRKGRKIPVLIYPSHEDDPAKLTFLVSWFGWYSAHVGSRNGTHPQGMKYRPQSTSKSASDNKGHWAIFWHIEGLRRLPKEKQLPISEIETVKGGWRKSAPPRGPELVSVPPSLLHEE